MGGAVHGKEMITENEHEMRLLLGNATYSKRIDQVSDRVDLELT